MTGQIPGVARSLDRMLNRTSPVRVAVVGDVILDRFLYGSVERISPEAPVPVVDVREDVYRLGGAANVVRNLHALGADVSMVGVVGDDDDADNLRERLQLHGSHDTGLVIDAARPTAVKTRVIAQHQQVVRFDKEDRNPLSDEVVGRLLERMNEAIDGADAVIVSDYGKGVVTERIMAPLRQRAQEKGLIVAVDPKPQNIDRYRGMGAMTPNAKETEAMCGINVMADADAERAGRALMEKLETRAMLITRGEKGMTLVQADGDTHHIPTRARDVFDVTGAGDTAISMLTLAWAAGCDLIHAAELANRASGIVVGKLGTAVVTPEELRADTAQT
jgi:D-beta-D-heptose 7-phosphate kinase/D-beta-D-heptose 1-phosphate adenosyltransferase